MAEQFTIHAPFQPTGDQPSAITALTKNVQHGAKAQTLLGVTGSGKTFTMANVIAAVQRPTLIISHNKTLAAQLASEFAGFFPKNAVQYFVSYYDYYQPEAYIPRSDTYIEKESEINEEIDRLRNAATHALLTRRDVIIVASVSCIYGIGSPSRYEAMVVHIQTGHEYRRADLLHQLRLGLYTRNDLEPARGTYRVRGETVDVFPAYTETGVRIVFHGDLVETIHEFDPLTGAIIRRMAEIDIFPSRHFVSQPNELPKVIHTIRDELTERLRVLKATNKLLEAQRLEQRTNFDLEMIEQTGFCSGIENYSRFFDFRQSGQPPATLLDYFPKDFLLFIDESHMSVPQVRAMYAGDRSRKQTLVDYGFRLPSALDNRPLQYDEFMARTGQTIYVSATPAPYELERSEHVVEQLIRPTGLLDPKVEIRPTKHQIDDLHQEILATIQHGERVIITTLTKRMAEDLTEYLQELKVKVQYLHSDVETFERLEILRDLRLGAYDVIIGINLLREGIDLPEVSLVVILDADKEGFLRSETALMQVMGRAARHLHGRVIMYADRVTGSMQRAIDETRRRRKVQEAYNQKHHITPTSIVKAVKEERLAGLKQEAADVPDVPKDIPPDEISFLIRTLTEKMDLSSKNLEFEKAAIFRDQIAELEKALPKKAVTQRGLGSAGRGKTKTTGRFGKRR